MVYMIRRWKGGMYYFYTGPRQEWSVHWQESAELTEEDAFDIARIYGGEVVPRSNDYGN